MSFPTRSVRRSAAATLAGAALALVAAPALAVTAGVSAASTPIAEDAAVAAAVAEPETVLPEGFSDRFGYRPVVLDGVAMRPDGDCSSPVTLPDEFETACKAHDLGYDLLRFAGERGAPLGPWARRDLDAALTTRMHTACDARAEEFSRARCHLMAEVASAAVAANSARQGFGVPVVEPMPAVEDEGNGEMVAAAGIAGIGAAAVPLLRLRRRPATGEVR